MDYSLKKDHQAIKQQIKEWELELNQIVRKGVGNKQSYRDLLEQLECLSHDMMTINM